jgi:hypothetical protein
MPVACKFLIFVCLLSALSPSLRGADASAETLFVRRIAPLLQEKCLACHGNDAEDIQGGLDLRQATGLKRGGDSQVAGVVPGQPDESPIYLAATRTHPSWSAMPPKESEQLSPQQLTWLQQWITAGATWPDPQRATQLATQHAESWSAEDGVVVATSGGMAEQWTQRRYQTQGLWAYQPVIQPAIPNVPTNAESISENQAAATNPIDAFIVARWPQALVPAPPAAARVLLRRVSLDLTGLPPSPTEIDQFLLAWQTSPERAYLDCINRLLDSPHYGERMAQHWLDVTRYADSSGFANDFERGNAWRYRDYVVRAFNSDKAYDQFIREQIAGDELDPNNSELIVATGFLRMGPWELTGMEVAKVARQRFLDDVTNSVGETFLAQSLQCCRCHDHKFDPVPTRDYYAVQAVFATTQLAERSAPFLAEENLEGFDEAKYLVARQAEYLQTLEHLDRKQLQAAQAWFQQQGLSPDVWNATVAKLQQPSSQRSANAGRKNDYQDIFSSARSTLAKQGTAEDQYPPKLLGFTPDDFGNERVARKGLQRLAWELERYQAFALAVYNGRTPQTKSITVPHHVPDDRLTEGELEQSCILIGGDPFSRGPEVAPGTLSVLVQPPTPGIPDSVEGRRRALADWIADPRNPLTARAIVNRIWLWHFGQALAGNPNNFGSTGKQPTHPELLDWLAATFVEQGWSFKQLQRLILTSQTYRRSAQHPDPGRLQELDPLGTSYAVFQPRRLTAEELRDAMLATTGELNRQLGGIPNRPEINLEAALQPRQVMGTFAAAWVPNPLPSQRHRRSLYALKIRGLPDPQLEVFNQPTPDFSCERRETSNVTPQVFSLFNGQSSHNRALALANRAINSSDNDRSAIEQCFLWALGRVPVTEEAEQCLAHWRAMEALIAEVEPTVVSPPQRVIRQAVEENTGERFEFEETLHAYADFVPDLQPSDVPLHTRALADVCLALLNSNEFCYVY